MFSKNKIFFILLPVIAVFAALFYYFVYWCNTPLYAVNEVRNSVQNHNVEKFEKYVDLHSVFDKAFEDVIMAESKINNDNVASNAFAMGILRMIKPAVVDLLVEETKASIADQSTEQKNSAGSKAGKKDPIADAMRNNLEKKLSLDKLKIKDISLQDSSKGQAIVNLVVHHQELNKDFELKLKMLLTEDDVWQIKEFTNLTEFIYELDRAQKAALASLNKPLLDKLNNSLTIVDKKIELLENINNSDNKVLSVIVTIKNNSNKNINRIYYDIEVFDDDNNIIYSYPERFSGTLPAGNTQLLNNQKILRPTLPADKMLMELDFDDLNWRIQPTYISFDDGEVIENNMY